MDVVGVGLATWVTVHFLRLLSAEFNRVLIAPVNVVLAVAAGTGWGLAASLDVWEIAAAIAVATWSNKVAVLVTTTYDWMQRRSRPPS